ncbi:Antitoxin YefM [Pirellulimonas nuda]|uniref:Antitoxin n=1 Tax=Pirellulimonas nuda TaxID=2528009 RepID=A0A518D5L6_9BACT|nr:type II toxin-antitoxin system prevent-host-death family antitoxin [Pirellulimonas nuda]QDU86772.1 Antitoxin YefM [Pirellulimonas nuda]
MAIQTSYSRARSQFASLLDAVTEDHEVVIVSRRGKEDIAMISAAELSGLVETAHLLRSQKNAKRLLAALGRAESKGGKPVAIDRLRRELNLQAE